ncbi:hypothetical protein GQ55_3G011600 [Panicum hallii var. hallii]|uniref:Uncharacterized protein n=1 Tax=Panicum hallii var. hallii TaxID=1504633 RepID=A0A2T7E4J1_9POAL|nr:hypothetical protein GQ55_3G011600 [Panicum hallii var. hallii]
MYFLGVPRSNKQKQAHARMVLDMEKDKCPEAASQAQVCDCEASAGAFWHGSGIFAVNVHGVTHRSCALAWPPPHLAFALLGSPWWKVCLFSNGNTACCVLFGSVKQIVVGLLCSLCLS